MTDRPTDPNESNPTTRFDPPEPEPAPSAVASPPPPPAAPPNAPAEPPPPSRPWPPPSWRRGGDDPGRIGTIVFGAILLVIGLWFFADQTLGLEMPNLRWSQLWPILLIGLGAWIAIGSMRRR
jgi:LiaI-LiaF-like transmembrane region